jgi:O-antigen ligase
VTALQAHQAFVKAQQQMRSAQYFPLVELGFLVIAIVLGGFVARKHFGRGRANLPSPLTFAALMMVMLGVTGVTAILWGPSHVVFALSFGAGVMLSLTDPVAALGFLLANLIVRPWELANMPEMGFIPKTLGGLSLASWIFHASRARKLVIPFDGPVRFFAAFMIWMLISALSAGDFMDGLQAYSGSLMIASIVFILVMVTPQSELDINVLEKVLVLFITISIAHAIPVTILQSGYDPSNDRLEVSGALGNSNDLAALIVIAFPLAVIPALRALRPRRGGEARDAVPFGALILALGSAPILLWGLWLTASRGAMLAVLVSGGIYVLLRMRNRRLALMLGALAVPMLFAFSSALNFARDSKDLAGSTESRTAFLLAAINMGLRNPIMGVGFQNFAKMWGSFAIKTATETGERTAHNTWALAFAEAGVPALILFVGMFLTTVKRALYVEPKRPELISAVAGYTVAMTFLSHTYTIYPYMIYALILAAARIKSEHAKAAGAAA